ncbi:CDP-alcohol phosphatidyltransferase family protein [Tropicimonas isoalkanivorans]|uniref:Phosphatidylglycerophosphate synthase n=1 Tax=Tropicimonas isoalkanivorans TaxID=441112 RepID=A0A1I1LLA8_9RHOB|nr:CDP-alcohol phosphatidyltransferase family protein [Tropicimonas isoalkanivorans]SFC73342.1 Phosphatidylglycerophosphate synthase [Tropicimonas isoalkanivorans]
MAAGGAALVMAAAVHLVAFADVPVPLWTLALAVLVTGYWVLDRHLAAHFPHDRFGACNTATLFRGALAAVLLTPAAAGSAAGWTVFALAAVALSLDAVDGWLARRTGLTSRYGARFDMEADSLLALALAMNALANGMPWPLAVVLGCTRYVFVAAISVYPWLGRPLPERFSRKAVCVLQISVLVAFLAPPLTGPAFTWLAVFASVAVLGSFARDIIWLRARR